VHRLVIALTTLLALVGAAFLAAYLFILGAAADRAARLAPADTAMYATLYLEPSTSQRMRLGDLLGRLPGFADEAALEEKIDQITQNLLAGAGIDYRERVKPWLGGQLAVAIGVPAELTDVTDPSAVDTIVIVEITDPAAAEASLQDQGRESGNPFAASDYEGVDLNVATDGSGFAIVEDMLVLGSSAAALESVVDVSAGAPALADNTGYRAAMAELPPDHLASLYLDLGRIGGSVGVESGMEGFTTASAVLVAEADGLHLDGRAPFDAASADDAARAGFALASEPSSLADWMPADTQAELVIFGIRQAIEQAEAAAAGTEGGQPLVDALTQVRALAAFGLGIDLDQDILPLLDREVAVAVGSLADGGAGQLLLRPTDPSTATDALGRVTERLEAAGAAVDREQHDGTEITTAELPGLFAASYAQVDGVIVLGMGPDDVAAALDAHATGQTLAASEPYRTAFDLAGVRAGNEAWIDLAAVADATGATDTLPADARDILQQIGALAFTAPSRDDHIEFHAVLTVE